MSFGTFRLANSKSWPEMIDAAVLAEIFGRSRRTAERWFARQEFSPPIRIAGKCFYRRGDLLRSIELHREPAKGGSR